MKCENVCYVSYQGPKIVPKLDISPVSVAGISLSFKIIVVMCATTMILKEKLLPKMGKIQLWDNLGSPVLIFDERLGEAYITMHMQG